MRIRTASLLLLVFLACGSVASSEEPPEAPSSDALVGWIQSGDEVDLERAARVAVDMDVEQLEALFLALRAHTDPLQRLKTQRLKGLDWDRATLDQIVAHLQKAVGVEFVVSPAARTRLADNLQVTLRVEDQSVATVLSLVTSPLDLVWEARKATIWIDMPGEAAETQDR